MRRSCTSVANTAALIPRGVGGKTAAHGGKSWGKSRPPAPARAIPRKPLKSSQIVVAWGSVKAHQGERGGGKRPFVVRNIGGGGFACA